MRHSKPTISADNESHKLYSSEEEKDALENRNVLAQFDEVCRMIVSANGVLALTPVGVQSLHFLATQDIYTYAGKFRDGSVHIENSNHEPPHSDQVPKLVEDMCQYANSHHDDPTHVAAYLIRIAQINCALGCSF